MASHLLEIVDQVAYRNSARRVLCVQVEIGGRRVFDPVGIMRHFQQAARGTVADGARLEIRFLPVHRHCRNCGQDFDEPDPHKEACAHCGHPRSEAVGGEEARVVNIEVDPAA